MVCAVGLGSAADACGVTNKGGWEDGNSIKPSGDCSQVELMIYTEQVIRNMGQKCLKN